ncbi:hypothetical protein bcere0025_18710 [Bacillus cereus F65185]|nr:hypothetical protein bcere0023_19620 [Bacillus cereus Rock4-2]EEL65297.1 hypothetical protein bcere0025_18710 [Bacillus cereus F65185]EJR99587.1 hypothetical protein IKG_01899 [Bacillus cereus VD200]QDD83301.1 hypothetical protein FORC087_2000 [Bacillus cereus]SCV21806.1 Uncharacterized protein BCRIVMBC845_04365 [Bacillus cereus]
MNKDSKAVKKEKGLFESVIAPIIVGLCLFFYTRKNMEVYWFVE